MKGIQCQVEQCSFAVDRQFLRLQADFISTIANTAVPNLPKTIMPRQTDTCMDEITPTGK